MGYISAVQLTGYLVNLRYLLFILSNFLRPQYFGLQKQSLKLRYMKSEHMKEYGLVYNNILQ